MKEKNSILESIGDGFFAVDKKWIVTYWNSNAELMLDVTRERIIGKNIWEIFPGQINTSYYEHLNAALDSIQLRHFESFDQIAEQWYEISAYPAENGLSVYFRNISERKRSDKLVREANERFNLVSRATSDVIWDWDISSGTVTRSEHNMKKIFGYKVSNEVNSNAFWFSNIHPDDVGRINLLFESTLKDVKELYIDCEYRFRKSNGTYAYVYDKGYIIRDLNGTPQRLIGAVQDITRLKEN